MDRKYEVYVNGSLAKRCLTYGGAEKVLEKFPNAKGQIFKVTPSVEIVLLKEYMPVLAGARQ